MNQISNAFIVPHMAAWSDEQGLAWCYGVQAY
jgi:hypothetical protein